MIVAKKSPTAFKPLVVLESGFIEDPSGLFRPGADGEDTAPNLIPIDSLDLNPQNVRNWELYKLEVVKELKQPSKPSETPEAPEYIYSVKVVSQVEQIVQLFSLLFDQDSNSYTVRSPLMLTTIEGSDSKIVVSGNSRIYFAQQLLEFVQSGEWPNPIRFEIPYNLYEMTASDISASQVIDNSGVKLSPNETQRAIAQLVPADLDIEKAAKIFVGHALQMLGRENKAQAYHMRSVFLAERSGFPVEFLRGLAPNIETIKDVIALYSKLYGLKIPELMLEIDPELIKDDLVWVAGEKPFTAARLKDLASHINTRLAKERPAMEAVDSVEASDDDLVDLPDEAPPTASPTPSKGSKPVKDDSSIGISGDGSTTTTGLSMNSDEAFNKLGAIVEGSQLLLGAVAAAMEDAEVAGKLTTLLNRASAAIQQAIDLLYEPE